MSSLFPKFEPQNESDSGTPGWALQRIKQAIQNQLIDLDLSWSTSATGDGRKLVSFPDEIFELSGLRTLDFSGNGLFTLPEAISRLHGLTSLDLRGNRLNTLPEAITQLQKLTTLNLSDNGLNILPEAITQLQNLTDLYLGGNGLNTLPEAITQLQNLKILVLNNNELNTLPEAISRLQNLTHLYLSNNELTTIPEAISRLPNLTYLYLSKNRLTTLPETITLLRTLTGLDLRRNGLSNLPEAISHLQNLTHLYLSNNELTIIPEAISRLPNLSTLILSDNPLISPPTEIADQGIRAIREYFRQLDQQGVDYLYEAKLLILGEGGAGKTTFAHKILDSNYALTEEESTKGVDVLRWSFPIEGNRQFWVNIWDFGGQEIYHATHQFFLTRRSLYALVADTRKEDTDFYYWINIAELLSDNSPLLIIKNEKQDRHREINERQLKGQFEGLKEVLATNLATNRGLQEAKDEIQHYIRKLPHIGSPLPKTWVRVREQLEKDPRNYIVLDEYFLICKANGFAEIKDSLQLSGYLHDIGVFLHFQDEPLLKKTVILKPKWGTDAAYKVLDNQTVIRNLGHFKRAELEAIWHTSDYENMRDELLQLMMKFKLCYEIPTQKGTYIAPQLLTENQPEYKWDEQENLLLRYTYEFMPKGILTQFIVIMHPYIWEQNKVWKSGIVIEKDGARAEVIEYYGKREIQVRVAGPQARDLMTIIRHELKQIHDAYKRLKYDELVRCNCSTCKDSQEPHFYPVSVLMEFNANNQLEIQCQKKPYNMVNVMGLLGDVIDLSKLLEKDVPPDVYYVQGDVIKGDKTMSEIKQTIKNSTIGGSANAMAAELIKDSFNTIQKSSANAELKDTLTQLTHAVENVVKELPKEKSEQAEKVASYIKRLSEEATKENPDREWYSVSIEGLTKAAQNLGKVGDEVIKLIEKVRKILTARLL